MSLGVAPVAPRHGAFPELITPDIDGLLFPPGDVVALAQVFSDVDEDPQRFDALGARARLSHESRFTPADNLARLESIYQFAIEHPVAGAEDKAPRSAPRPGRGARVNASGDGVPEETIAAFWETHPCGDAQVGGLQNFGDYEAFFDAYDSYRYTKEAHIPDCLDQLHLDGKRVLEIGLGEGADSEQIVRRGAHWSGVDLTNESVERVRTRLGLRGLAFDDLKQGSALDLPWPDATFDMVLSHGVLHHVPDVLQAQKEIHRVLKPGGELVVMMYARWSLNYLVSIKIVRRLALLAAYPIEKVFPRALSAVTRQHVALAREMGMGRYLKIDEFLSRNTDGPLNRYSKVYDRGRLAQDFPDFQLGRSFKRFMHAPPLPMPRRAGERLAGWHLWAQLKSR
jgi:ubiquinone/menaquinone biosynthesis C-methylase UbiE